MRTSFFFALLLVACGSSESSTPTVTDTGTAVADTAEMDHDSMTMTDTGTSTDDTATSTDPVVEVGSYYYKPAMLTVKAGTKVRFVWKGGTHTVTSGSGCTKDGKFDSGNHTGTTYVFEHTFDTAGSYPYFCDYMSHCAMGQKGTITVTP